MDNPHGVFLNMFNYQSSTYKAHTPELKKVSSVLHTVGASSRVLQYDYNRNEMVAEAKDLEMVPTALLLLHMMSFTYKVCVLHGSLSGLHQSERRSISISQAVKEARKWNECTRVIKEIARLR